MAETQLPTCIPFPIDKEQLQDIVEKSKDWAIMHGAGMRSKTNFNPNIMQFAPFILTPTAFPRKEFVKAVNLQTTLNELMHNVAHNVEFLKETLKNTIKSDEFTARLYKIWERTLVEGTSQNTLSLGLLRSDYLAHSFDDNSIKQVEINTVASSFGGISTYLTPMHRYILKELGHGDKLENLPKNDALSGLCNGMIEAWKIQKNNSAAILFVVEDITYNICDQRFHEFYIRETNPEISVIRKSLSELNKQAKLGPNNELFVNNIEISVVYYRAGYEPNHYQSELEWDARWLIEKSIAIKCPSIQYHLAGTKKVQQALANPINLRKFIKNDEQLIAITEIFTGLFSLDDTDEGDAAYQLAMKNPEQYVLKPQREGGGNNIYGADIPEALEKMSVLERTGWILMERIFPPIAKGYMIRADGELTPPIVDLVSELGIFGVIIGNANEITYNRQAGHMLRTKLSSSDEGGVAAGMGALDSPFLID